LQRLLASSVLSAASQLQHVEAEACSIRHPLSTTCYSHSAVSHSAVSHSASAVAEATSAAVISTTPTPAQLTSLSSHQHSTTSLSSSFMQTLKEKLRCQHPLHHLTFTCEGLDKGEGDEIQEMWRARWGQAAEVKLRGCHVALSVSS
jgi:hypothetical protein